MNFLFRSFDLSLLCNFLLTAFLNICSLRFSVDRLRIDLALSSFHPFEVHAVLISCIFRPHLLFEQNVRTAAVYMLAIMNRTYGRFGYKPICDGGAFPFGGEIFGEWVDVLEHTGECRQDSLASRGTSSSS